MQAVLSGKRQAYHQFIRKDRKNTQLQFTRFKFIQQHRSDFSRLINIDCIKCIQTIKQQDNYFRIEEQIKDLFIYAVSDQNNHLFSVFNQQIVNKLIQILQWTLDYEGKNHTENQIIKSIRTKCLWIFINYTENKADQLSKHQTLQLFQKCFRSQIPDICAPTLEILQKLCNIQEFYQAFIKSNAFVIFLENNSKFKTIELSLILSSIFLKLNNNFYSSIIRNFVLVLIERLNKSQQQNQVNNIINSLMSLFDTQLIENANIILQNFECFQMAGKWLIQQMNLQKKVNSDLITLIFHVFKNLFINEYQINEIDLCLKSLFSGTFISLAQGLTQRSTVIKVFYMEIIEAVCANCQLIPFLVQKNGILQIIYDFIQKQGYEIKKLCLNSICNIILAGQEENILPVAFKFIDVLTIALSQNYDIELNTLILQALLDIFSYGQREQKNEKNPFYNRFIIMDGQYKLSRLKLRGQSSKIQIMINKIQSQYEHSL